MDEKGLDKKDEAEGTSGSGIDFAGVKALADSSYVPEPWYKSLGNSLLEGLVKLGEFLLVLLLDILKALWTIVSGIFIYAYKIVVGLGRFCRTMHRRFHEVDGFGKASFFLEGIGNIRYGQVVDGLVFMGVEILYILFMALSGVNNIAMLIDLAGGHRDSPTRLVLGIATILITVAYVVVYIKGIQSTYDCYQITHNFEFVQARKDQINVLTNAGDYPDIDFLKDSSSSIKKKMRLEYGYSALSARYISYVPFKRTIVKEPLRIVSFFRRIGDKIYQPYAAWRDKVRAGRWGRVLTSLLAFQRKPVLPTRGRQIVLDELRAGLTSFEHTYDKYNNYLAITRDTSTEIEILSDPDRLISACYAEDELSRNDGIKPAPHDGKLKTKAVVSRVVGAYEVSLPIAKSISKFAVKVINEEVKKGTPDSAKQAIVRAYQERQKWLNAFVDRYSTRRLASLHALQNVYSNYGKYRSLYDRGKKAFVSELHNSTRLPEEEAVAAYDDFKNAVKNSHGSEEQAKLLLSRRADRFQDLVSLYEATPFHGEPIRFKKQIKQYGDEKFAVTVLTLPVLGAMITVIIPLIFSIVVAFTYWNSDHTAYNFGWSLEGFQKVFDIAGGSNFSVAFVTLLYWTIIWAFFATFTNYIFGIVLALMINKKGIKLKKMWRTLFVITIAIPQFITLLCINLLLSDGGAVNAWLGSMGLGHFPFLGTVQNPSADIRSGDYIIPKITIILVNMWIGIPYTMLSTSGILMNIPEDLYESARIDGASPWVQFWKITMPYILFVTGPSLLTSFIGNINNFNVIYFLTGGGPTYQDSLGLAQAGHTDLLITWLFKLTTADSPEYNIASVIGIAVFVVCAFFSLIMYKRMGSVQNEEEFQ